MLIIWTYKFVHKLMNVVRVQKTCHEHRFIHNIND